MREIKFRAWLGYTMVQVIKMDLIKDTNGRYTNIGEGYFLAGSNKGGHTGFNMSDAKFLEFTGLKDKNGCKEVYEGDIITIEGEIGGNIYENEPRTSDIVIPQIGTKAWETAYKKTMERGLRYAE